MRANGRTALPEAVADLDIAVGAGVGSPNGAGGSGPEAAPPGGPRSFSAQLIRVMRPSPPAG